MWNEIKYEVVDANTLSDTIYLPTTHLFTFSYVTSHGYTETACAYAKSFEDAVSKIVDTHPDIEMLLKYRLENVSHQ